MIYILFKDSNNNFIGTMEKPSFVPRVGECVNINSIEYKVLEVNYNYRSTAYQLRGMSAGLLVEDRIQIIVKR